jgi:hypothetical protein
VQMGKHRARWYRGDTPRWRRDKGVVEAVQDSGVPGVGDELRCLTKVVADTWSTGKLRGSEEQRKFGLKTRGGGGAHHEAKVAAMAALKPIEWRGVRCPRGPRELAA